ncbi:E3 ubiquitin-protein ligase MIB2-like isoform X1 [Octopus vulgaris]|uniref:E3 ubiquitin-protein ligase MIB2-like isoform X1 n=1 Tax=Octopus vulgaris TaxID=6645 RepID=A0AA36HJ99_OCTVU|nr:E3 ubiquitin-protein ligase MIB2-like isoform X1 [Octopus vulgaris]
MSSLIDAASRRSASSAQNFPLLSETGIAAFRVDPAVLIHIATHSGLQVINKPIEWFGATPLMFASREEADIRIIDILIDAGGDMGAKDQWGQTALHWAVTWRRLQAVELLLSRGSNVNEKTNGGYTPLYLAARLYPEWTDGMKAIMKQSAVEVNPRNEAGRTPLHWACSWGRFHTVELLLGHNGIDANVVGNDGDTPLQVAVQRGANVNVVEHGGNNCLHLALKRENNFHSEVEHMTMLDQFCVELKLGNEERCSGVVVACYLAHHGANFYCKNKSGRTPLDLIEKENLKKTLKTLFRPTQCRYCHKNMATVRLQPCGDLVLCENCSSEMTFKRCPVCREYTLSKSEFEAPKFEDKCVQREATCQELGAASQAIEIAQFVQEATKTSQQVGIFLGIPSIKLEIIECDNPLNTVEQSYQMLRRWVTSCDPDTNKFETLKESLKKAQCLTALLCLLNIK